MDGPGSVARGRDGRICGARCGVRAHVSNDSSWRAFLRVSLRLGTCYLKPVLWIVSQVLKNRSCVGW